ncbi:MAG: hypothetical protein ACNYVW_00695 [Methanosarcinales archaeon]
MKKQIVLMLVGLLCLTSITYAGVSANYDLSWHVLSGGGCGQMNSATYALSSTVGQIIGSSESSNYRVGAGYWYGTVSTTTSRIKFDTGPGTYPSISGTYNGTFTPTQTITVSKLYTYPCAGTGGHSEHVLFWNVSRTVAEGRWAGYQEAEWSYINFSVPFKLAADEQYSFSIRTGSYPQVIHSPALTNANGTINCTEFVDVNGKSYNDWIPALRLE